MQKNDQRVFSEWLTRKIKTFKKNLFHFSDFAYGYFHVLSFCDKSTAKRKKKHPDIIG